MNNKNLKRLSMREMAYINGGSERLEPVKTSYFEIMRNKMNDYAVTFPEMLLVFGVPSMAGAMFGDKNLTTFLSALITCNLGCRGIETALSKNNYENGQFEKIISAIGGAMVGLSYGTLCCGVSGLLGHGIYEMLKTRNIK